MQHTCEKCGVTFKIKRHETVLAQGKSLIRRGTGLNMVYKGNMNREYAHCPCCGTVEHQFSAEARDQDEGYEWMRQAERFLPGRQRHPEEGIPRDQPWPKIEYTLGDTECRLTPAMQRHIKAAAERAARQREAEILQLLADRWG